MLYLILKQPGTYKADEKVCICECFQKQLLLKKISLKHGYEHRFVTAFLTPWAKHQHVSGSLSKKIKKYFLQQFESLTSTFSLIFVFWFNLSLTHNKGRLLTKILLIKIHNLWRFNRCSLLCIQTVFLLKATIITVLGQTGYDRNCHDRGFWSYDDNNSQTDCAGESVKTSSDLEDGNPSYELKKTIFAFDIFYKKYKFLIFRMEVFGNFPRNPKIFSRFPVSFLKCFLAWTTSDDPN